MADIRRRTETILVLAATDYQFTYHLPSLLAASAIMTALQSLYIFNSIQSDNSQSTFNNKHLILHHTNDEQFITGVNLSREIKLRLQTATHTAMVCIRFTLQYSKSLYLMNNSIYKVNIINL